MARPSRQDLIDRISTKVADLKKERAGLQERLRIVDQLLAEYQILLEPPGSTPAGNGTAKPAGSRSQARQQRREVMVAFLHDRDEAPTAEIIQHVQQVLPHDTGVTRAAVTDVLRFENDFVKVSRGVWRLRRPDDPAADQETEP